MIQPLTQLFAIPPEYTEGCFISSVSLFFSSKDAALPVLLQFGPTVAGNPNYAVAYPDSQITVYPSDIAISTTAATATVFNFKVPVYLLPGLHYFSVRSNSKLYNLYTATIGANQLGGTTKITKSPYSGAIFTPDASSSLIPSDVEDIKFVMNRCRFSLDVGTAEFANTFQKYNDPVEQTAADTLYDMLNVTVGSVEYGSNTLGFSLLKTNSAGIVTDGTGKITNTFSPYTPGTNMTVDRSLLNLETTKLKAELKTSNDAVTPVVNVERINGVFVQQLINSDTTGELSVLGGNAMSKYVTKPVELLPEIDANDLVAYALLKMPVGTDVKIYYKAAATGVNMTLDVSYKEMTKTVMGTPSTSEFVEYKFVTPSGFALTDESYFSQFQFKIVMTSLTGTETPIVKDFRGIALND